MTPQFTVARVLLALQTMPFGRPRNIWSRIARGSTAKLGRRGTNSLAMLGCFGLSPHIWRISQFFGIVVAMYYNDHLPPHFHAIYAEYEATLGIETLEVLSGQVPRRALALVLEWAVLHRAELLADWERAREGVPLEPIEPLD